MPNLYPQKFKEYPAFLLYHLKHHKVKTCIIIFFINLNYLQKKKKIITNLTIYTYRIKKIYSVVYNLRNLFKYNVPSSLFCKTKFNRRIFSVFKTKILKKSLYLRGYIIMPNS